MNGVFSFEIFVYIGYKVNEKKVLDTHKIVAAKS